MTEDQEYTLSFNFQTKNDIVFYNSIWSPMQFNSIWSPMLTILGHMEQTILFISIPRCKPESESES